MLNVASKSEVKSVEWYKDENLVLTDDESQFSDGKLTTTYKDSDIEPADAGSYECKFSFNLGDPITKSIPVKVHREYPIQRNYYLSDIKNFAMCDEKSNTLIFL